MSAPLPVHFFTIVLNGMPFLRYHIEMMRRLPFEWHWHVVEGVAALRHDTAYRGVVPEALHRNGLSNDGTTEYLDALAREFPENVHIYRKPGGEFWDGKREMVNAPLPAIGGECLLWEIDGDEFWTTTQVRTAHRLFTEDPEATAALYYCHYFVSETLVLRSRDRGLFANYEPSEWRRTWRFRPGMKWLAHEPPQLAAETAPGVWTDLVRLRPIPHAATAREGLVFQHFSSSHVDQLRFKEIYYGNPGMVADWERLRGAARYPVFLRDYMPFVGPEEARRCPKWRRRLGRLFPSLIPGAMAHPAEREGIVPLAYPDEAGAWHFRSAG